MKQFLEVSIGKCYGNIRKMQQIISEEETMMPWNRREVWMGSSQQEFSRIKNLLAENGIPYDFNVRSTSWSGGRGLGDRGAGMMRTGEDVAQLNTYSIYVHKYEYEKSVRMIRKTAK